MKKIILFLLFPALLTAQEQTIELLDIFSRVEQTICLGDTLETLFFRVEKTTTENGTPYPNTRIDTILYQNGACPADSLNVLSQLQVEAVNLNQKAAGRMNQAFESVRRGFSVFQSVRTVYNNFTGSDLYLYIEDQYFGAFDGVWRIVDVQASTSVLADMIRVGAQDRYRLEVQAGEPGAGTRYTVIPLSPRSFQVNQWTPAGGAAGNYRLYKDLGTDNTKPVFREAGYLSGGTDDRLRIVKVR